MFLNWVFITKYGYIAAGYTTVFCYLLFSAGHYLLYKYLSKKYLAGISIINFKLIGAVTIALMIVMGAVLALYKITIARYGVIFAIILVAVQLLLRLGTFQLSDIFYNTVGGVLGGLMYCAVMKVRKRL